ncbi:MAG: hypothetical protein KDI82_02850 [Gammaproteobacteria bacterium]|nr:hypothetical protein [Gammaproteobacteria bacterium]
MSDKSAIDRVTPLSGEQQSMAQIREILFGEQVRQTEQHFARLETQLEEQQRTLRTLLDGQIDRLGGQIDQLRTALENQEQSQGRALEELNGSLSTLLARLDERLTLLDSDHQDSVHKQQQAAAQQQSTIERLQRDTAERAQLAGLLENMAAQLRRAKPE